MRFFYAIVAAIGWIIMSPAFVGVTDDSMKYLALAIIMAGAMAGGD